MIRGYEIVKIEGVKKEASGSPGSFYIQSEKRGIPFFLDNIYNRKNTLYRVISEPSGIERVITSIRSSIKYKVISEPSGIESGVFDRGEEIYFHVISEPSGIESYLNQSFIRYSQTVISEPSGIER